MRAWLAILVLVVGSTVGCGGAEPVAPQAGSGATPSSKSPAASKSAARTGRNPGSERADLPDLPLAIPPAAEPAIDVAPPTKAISDEVIRAAGLRRIEGKHLSLYTDLPANPEIDELPAVFDAAYPQWCAYFHQPEQRDPPWHMHGFLMGDRQRFKDSGALPDEIPNFRHGFNSGLYLWFDEQPSAYYRRHLLLHEGTHGFMGTRLGGTGPTWYAEGMAELLATHRWADGKLTLDWFPTSREEVPLLGRIKLVQEGVRAGHLQSIAEIESLSPSAHHENDAYAWSWALAALLDHDMRYQARFRALAATVRQGGFDQRFHERFANDWDQLNDQWAVFASTIEHNYDFQRAAIQFASGKPLAGKPADVTIAADRGWQSSAIHLEAGKHYRLNAKGRYQVADKPKPWECEPGGVTIRYVDGRPLGALLGAVRPDKHDAEQVSALARPLVIGLERELVPTYPGTLYFRVNDSPAELADNAGQLHVEIAEEK